MRFIEILGEAAEPQFAGNTYTEFSDLRKAIEKSWGAIPKFDRVTVSNKGSVRGFTKGRSNLVNPATGEVVGFWELTGADMIPGQGTVTMGYGQVAVPKKTPKKSAAKAEVSAKPAEASAPATPEEISQATAELLAAFKKRGGSYARYRVEGADSFEVRYWGNWETPADVEDEEDYDWQELTDESAADVNKIVNDVQVAYPNVKCEVQAGEKNWITADMSSKL